MPAGTSWRLARPRGRERFLFAACRVFLRNQILGAPGDWRMLATSANGQPAAATYTRGRSGRLQPYGICVLTVTGEGIRRVSSFGDASLIPVFGYRPDVPAPVTLPGGRGLTRPA